MRGGWCGVVLLLLVVRSVGVAMMDVERSRQQWWGKQAWWVVRGSGCAAAAQGLVSTQQQHHPQTNPLLPNPESKLSLPSNPL